MTGPWTAHAGATLLGGTITLVEGSSFCLSSPSGDVLPGLPHGLIYRDTRFVSDLRLRINGRWPESLGALTLDPFSASFVLRDPPQPGLADSQLLITRHRYVGRGTREDIDVRNFAEAPRLCGIELNIDADFADVFAVKEGRASNEALHLGICGEHGGDPASVVFCHEIGLDYVSCSPFRVETARLAAGQAAVGESEQTSK